ncbi:acyl-homoserine-lactone synthase [Sphingobium sp. B2D3C]|uniref:acyl-homoserine-lactone synthase n=1 Tax=Sphingobium sp. B2D3C TaxID=2940581 RepID=UPI0022246BF2|nr:acyl-homoserine-lactone synthase [Sphingobium sp. B2D3C]MCW2397919.1 acyl-homoserine lactone synthase [Sphingobium sp. B2D3C]
MQSPQQFLTVSSLRPSNGRTVGGAEFARVNPEQLLGLPRHPIGASLSRFAIREQAMIHLIENHLEPGNRPLLESMFADRKLQFVDFFGWDVPVVDGRFEIDQFDGPRAVYIIAADDEGRHEASMRMLPTVLPHLLDTLFPHLCFRGVPTGPTTWESTRLCLPQRHGATRRLVLRDRLISAMVDFALARGIDRITGVIPDGFRKLVLAMGWKAQPLGPAVRIRGGMIGAFAIDIDRDTPDRLGWTGVYRPAEERIAA